MNNFFIITNTFKDPEFELTKKISEYIEKKGGMCPYLHKNQGMTSVETFDSKQVPADTEAILVIGGDGTLIKAAGDTKGMNIPLIGINLGNLGYLCELEEKTVFGALDQLFDDKYVIENRMMINGQLFKKNDKIKEMSALNDIVIHRCGALHIISFNVYVNGEFLNSYKADGIIVATPTGSTAYNMSAGGPIVDPKANMILVTPINSHMLNSRSIVLSAEDVIEIEVGSRGTENDDPVEVSFDGNSSERLETGDRIVIKRAETNTEIIKLSKLSFLEILRKKMQTYH